MNNTVIRKRDIYDESMRKVGKQKIYQVGRSGEHKADITIRCKRRNQFLLGYDLVHDDDRRILERVTLPPCRCKRVLTLMKYTEGILRRQAQGNVVRI